MDQLSSLVSQALWLIVWLSLPAVVVSAGVGMLVSFFQAITSLQDSSVSQGIKLFCVGLTVLVAAPWGAQKVLAFANTAIQLIFKGA